MRPCALKHPLTVAAVEHRGEESKGRGRGRGLFEGDGDQRGGLAARPVARVPQHRGVRAVAGGTLLPAEVQVTRDVVLHDHGRDASRATRRTAFDEDSDGADSDGAVSTVWRR